MLPVWSVDPPKTLPLGCLPGGDPLVETPIRLGSNVWSEMWQAGGLPSGDDSYLILGFHRFYSFVVIVSYGKLAWDTPSMNLEWISKYTDFQIWKWLDQGDVKALGNCEPRTKQNVAWKIMLLLRSSGMFYDGSSIRNGLWVYVSSSLWLFKK